MLVGIHACDGTRCGSGLGDSQERRTLNRPVRVCIAQVQHREMLQVKILSLERLGWFQVQVRGARSV
jgi:hypothetical protein